MNIIPRYLIGLPDDLREEILELRKHNFYIRALTAAIEIDPANTDVHLWNGIISMANIIEHLTRNEMRSFEKLDLRRQSK